MKRLLGSARRPSSRRERSLASSGLLPCVVASPLEFWPLFEKVHLSCFTAAALPPYESVRERPHRPLMITLDEAPQTFLRHHRILILSEDVLELLGSGDKSLSGPSHDRLREFSGVAGPLHLDPHRVKVSITGLLGQSLDSLAEFLELVGRNG